MEIAKFLLGWLVGLASAVLIGELTGVNDRLREYERITRER